MISRCHPVANWLRLPPHEHRRALDRVLDFRDRDPGQTASGTPAAAIAYFWQEELPQLMHRPEVRACAQERIDELNAKAADLRQQIHRVAGSMQADADAAEAEASRINAVMEANQ